MPIASATVELVSLAKAKLPAAIVKPVVGFIVNVAFSDILAPGTFDNTNVAETSVLWQLVVLFIVIVTFFSDGVVSPLKLA